MVVRGAGTAIVLAHVLCLGACIAFAATRDLSNGAAAEPADAAEEAEAPDAAGCEGALSSNCGTCNRDCGGEPCVAGECAVTVLASKQLAPIAIARDATRVYWTSYDKDLGAVMACDKAGCNDTPTVIADHEGGPSALAIAGDRVFWSDVDTAQVRCRPFDADAGPPTTVTNSVTVSFSLVFAGNVLHFGDDTYGGVRSLTQWSLDGCRS